MKLGYLRAFIVLVAGLVTIILNMKTHKEVTTSLLILLIVLLVFYFIGTLIMEIFQKSFDDKSKQSNLEIIHDEDENEDEQHSEEVHVSFEEEEETE